MKFPTKIDAQAKTWIQKEFQALTSDPKYSPNLARVDGLIESWEENNPEMYRRLQAQKLTRPFAQVIQAKTLEYQELLEQDGFPLTDAREQAEQEWYIQPEETQQTSPLEDLLDPRTVRLQTPLYR